MQRADAVVWESVYRTRGDRRGAREKSLRIDVHHADGVVWEPVYRTRLVGSGPGPREQRLVAEKTVHHARRPHVVVLHLLPPAHDERVHDPGVARELEEDALDERPPVAVRERLDERPRVEGPYEAMISGWS